MTDAVVDPHRIAANWAAISAELDAPRPSLSERALRWFGVPARTTRLMAATPALRRSWFVALAVTVVIALGAADASRPRESLFALLFLAPLLPVLGVTFAYGPGADPAYEITIATPKSGIRLVLVRTAVVLGVALAVLGSTSLLTPGPSALAFAWLLPSVATTACTLAAMTTVAPRRAAIGVTAGWMAAVVVAGVIASDRLGAFSGGAQAAWALLAVGALVIAHRRRERFDLVWSDR